MALQQILVRTDELNSTGEVKLDIGGYDYCIVQIVAPTGTVSFATSNDANPIQGASDGNATSSDNYVTVQGINLATSAAVSSLATGGLVRFGYIGQFLRISTPSSVGKCIVRLFKIN